MASISLQELHAQGPFLKRLARALVRDESEAEDLVQETWLAALKGSHGPRDQEEARGWLARLLRNRARSTRRGAARRRARELAFGSARGGAAVPGGAAIAERVLGAVLALEEPYKALVLQRYYQGLTPTVIAAETDTPLKTVESRLRRARELLRARLDGECGGRSSWCVALVVAAGVERPARLAGAIGVAACAVGIAGVALLGWKLSNLGGPEGPVDVPLTASGGSAEAPAAGLASVELVEPAEPILARGALTQEAVPEAPAEVVSAPAAPDAPSARVEGRVICGPDDAPWAGVTALAGGRALATLSTECASDGTFAFDVPLVIASAGIDEQVTHVRVIAVARGLVPRTRVLAISDGDVLRPGFVLDFPGAGVSGIALDRNDEPLAGATVVVSCEKASEGALAIGPYTLAVPGHALLAVETTTDANGRFRASGLRPWRSRVVVVPAAAEEVLTLRLDDGGSGQVVLPPIEEVVVRPTLSELFVQVEDEAGPLAGATIVRAREESATFQKADRLLERGVLTRTDVAESFAFAELPEDGRVRLMLEPGERRQVRFARDGYEPVTRAVGRGRAGADGWMHVELVRVVREPALVVRARPLSGSPSGAFTVRVEPSAKAFNPFAGAFEQPFDAEAGVARIAGVPPGRYDVALVPPPFDDQGWLPGRAPARVDASGDTPVDVPLARGGFVQLLPSSDLNPAGEVTATLTALGVSVDALGRPGAAPEPIELAAAPSARWTAEQPTRLYPAVPAGAYALRVLRDGEELLRQDVAVAAGASLTVAFEPPPSSAEPAD